ncbi:MAG: class I SAM-dependent methyltransferase [Chloroflexi bacterium]|nr:class I SAM-dependent methyltransferase [Chloroflexota bacterium]
MSNTVRAIVYGILNVLLFPVTLIGYVIWVGKILVSGRRSGVSSTAQAPLVGRWGLHNLGTRRDEASNRLLMVLPGISPLAVHLTSVSVLFGYRVTGYVPALYRYPYEGDIPPQAEAAGRMAFFDSVVERYLPNITQFVILGAGFDTRAFRLPENSGVRSFEVDAPKTQTIKREALDKAGIDSKGSRVTFVSADFEKEDWLTKLVDAGFDLAKSALFVWEGVTMYLDRQAVEATLQKIAGTAKGSIVAFDYYTDESLLSPSLYWRFARAATKAAGEPLKFGIDSTPPAKERLAEFLRSAGLELCEYRMLGHETEGKRAWGGFAVASV